MICNTCGMQLPDGSTFCPNCGTPTAAQPQAYPQEPQQFDSQQGWSPEQQQAYYQVQQQACYQGQQVCYQGQQNYNQAQPPYDQSQPGYYQAQQQAYSQGQQAYYQEQQPQAYGAVPYQAAPAAASGAKKRRSPLTWILIGAAALALLAVVVLVIVPKVQKSKQYDNALQYMENGMYDKAIVYFEELGDYSDAPEKINEANYRKAKSLLEEGRFDDSMALFRELGDYSDSRDMIDEVKYQFVKKHFDPGDQQTYAYLKELKDRNWKDAADLYAELYAWTLTVTALNTDLDDETTLDTVISKYTEAFNCMGLLDGGAPGEQLEAKVFLALPDGSYEDLGEFEDALETGDSITIQRWDGLFYDPDAVTGGPAQVQLRDLNTDELIAVWDFELSDDYIWKVKLLYANTEKDDKYTTADSISKYATYYHYKLQFYGGDPTEQLNVTEKTIYPDGFCEVSDRCWTNITSGATRYTYSEDYFLLEPELMPNGTMRVELYNADTDEFLGAFETQLTDEAVAEPAFKGTVSLKFSGDDPDNKEDVTTNVSRFSSYFQYGYYDSDASSSGKVTLRKLTFYPNGEIESKSISCNFDENDYHVTWWAQGLANDSYCSQAGPLVVKFYDAVSNQLVGEFSFNVTDDKPERSIYVDKITKTWINGKSGDNNTTAASVGVGKYLDCGFKVEGAVPGETEGAVPGETLTVQRSILYPDGSSGKALSSHTVKEGGTIFYGCKWESGINSTGTLEIYLYDHDTYDLLTSFSIEVTK